jgi:hypothetical protein
MRQTTRNLLQSGVFGIGQMVLDKEETILE